MSQDHNKRSQFYSELEMKVGVSDTRIGMNFRSIFYCENCNQILIIFQKNKIEIIKNRENKKIFLPEIWVGDCDGESKP